METLLLCNRNSQKATKKHSEPRQAILACDVDEPQVSVTSRALTITIMVVSDGFHAYRIARPFGVDMTVNMSYIGPAQVETKPLLFKRDNISETHHLLKSEASFSCGQYPWNVNVHSVIQHGYSLYENWNQYGNDQAVLVKQLSSSTEFHVVCDNALLIFRDQSSACNAFAVLLYRFFTLSAHIKEMHDVKENNHILKLVEINSEKELPNEVGDRVSKRLANGDVVSVSIKPILVNDKKDWRVSVTLDPATPAQDPGEGT